MKQDLNYDIFNFAFQGALLDATKRVYHGDSSLIIKNNKVKLLTKQYIDQIICGKFPDFYEYEKIIEKEIQKTNPDFGFGNTQKLLNIVCKNFYFITYSNPELRPFFSRCHCPLDAQIKQAVLSDLSDFKIDCEKEFGYSFKSIKKIFSESWSKIKRTDIKQYTLFQDCVKYLSNKMQISPIEYDYAKWKNDQTIQIDASEISTL